MDIQYSCCSFNEAREPMRLPEERSIAHHSDSSTNRSGFMAHLPNTYEALASSSRRSALLASRDHEASKFDQSEPDSSYGYRTVVSSGLGKPQKTVLFFSGHATKALTPPPPSSLVATKYFPEFF